MILAQIAVAIVIALVFNQLYIGLKVITSGALTKRHKKRKEETEK